MKQLSNIETAGNWIKNSVMLKLTGVTLLILILLIPTSMIQSIIEEREMMNYDAKQDVSTKWGSRQLINGPILSIPVIYEKILNEKTVEIIRYQHILPELLDIKSEVSPEKLRRGIYEIVVYRSNISLSGNFEINPSFDNENLKKVKWEDAFITIGISDLRGIEDEIELSLNGQKLPASPGSKIQNIARSGITIYTPDLETAQNQKLTFQLDLKLQGSENLSFTPIGSKTTVQMTSPWVSPSFNGNFLPDSRNLTEDGFSASWKVLQLNRNYPQSWSGDQYAAQLNTSSFGVDLILPLDDYQKSMRSAKYAIMSIALTFLIFFLVEILNGRKIHPFQYTLVGLALCLFYILLISITEHSNFNFAYLVSAVCTTSMIALYSLSVFKTKKLSMLLGSGLIGLYGFLFVILQLSDYALLMGSIGLTIIISATMYFTRKINWYDLNKSSI